ncbi:hypothetical protein CMK22_09305 [Candidatus Poribacteria bacterium]|nr:hypothetical protein [Candidatus Poribacteria bacterium]
MKLTKNHKIVGNYEINLEIESSNSKCSHKVLFSANQDLSKLAYLEIKENQFIISRKLGKQVSVWKEYSFDGNFPWKIKILRKGNYFRLWVNQETGAIRGPLGEWENYHEPWESFIGLEVPENTKIEYFNVTSLPWLSEHNKPVIQHGPDGSFYEQQAIPGAILKFNNEYFMYFMAGMQGDQEGSAKRSVGVAISQDLIDWEVQPEPIIKLGDINYSHDNIYPGGAVITPEGKVAVMYATQKFPDWTGFGLAIADQPLGPFTHYTNNPVYKHFSHAHEFDLVHINNEQYLLFFAGFTPNPARGTAGDRGYLFYSDNLIDWKPDTCNPVFSPETLRNWDAIHVRPRSLNYINNTWYLWYEGCNHWTPPGHNESYWFDTVGLARSKDLIEWDYYPRNPALPGLGTSGQFDQNWVGWPRMVIKDEIGYIFYTASGNIPPSIGLRRIPIQQLINWETEGGETINLLN